jgi:pimeloyl-ACP methyl ester carboxylesterase
LNGVSTEMIEGQSELVKEQGDVHWGSGWAGGDAMATYVLVHGAWLGGWCWRRVTPHVRRAGHEVYTPTLTGLGERAHLLSRAVDLDTHVQDIVNVLDYEDLHEVILLGHSYGGMVVSGVAERVPQRLARLVYLDAWFPMDNDRSLAELGRRLLPGFLPPLEARTQADGEGWMVPIPGGPEYPLPLTEEADLAWVRAHVTPHPARTFYDRLATGDPAAAALPRTFIICPMPGQPARFAPFAERARRDGWACQELAGGHFVFATMPAELGALLATQARAAATLLPGR